VRPRAAARLYHVASRAWLTAAGLTLLLPDRDRLGIWLPLHLTLAGAVSVAISGSMQGFASALTATPAPPVWTVIAQWTLVNAGVALIGFGYPSGHPALLAFGGACFLFGMAVLAWMVARAWRRGLNRRHALPMAMYGCALLSILTGGTLGALIGGGAVHDPALWIALRHAHMTVNVLGWVSLTISGTLVTLLPTVLRIRMPTWHGGATALFLVGGVAMIAGGLGLSSAPVAAVGGVAYALGALGLVWMVGRAITSPRRWPVPVSAKHLVLAVCWFAFGAIALSVALVRGVASFDAFRELYLVAFVGGWIVQTLLGAWLYLLPMARPGHPDERRRLLSAIEFGGLLQVGALDGGLVLMALRAGGLAPEALGAVGTGLALGGAALALAKAWAFPLLARAPVLSERQLGVWGG
jgi:nitrite reductase (NO-forming)